MKRITENNVLKALFAFILCNLLVPLVSSQDKASGEKAIRDGNVGGYMITKVEKVDTSYNSGYSMYAAAWPLVR